MSDCGPKKVAVSFLRGFAARLIHLTVTLRPMGPRAWSLKTTLCFLSASPFCSKLWALLWALFLYKCANQGSWSKKEDILKCPSGHTKPVSMCINHLLWSLTSITDSRFSVCVPFAKSVCRKTNMWRWNLVKHLQLVKKQLIPERCIFISFLSDVCWSIMELGSGCGWPSLAGHFAMTP